MTRRELRGSSFSSWAIAASFVGIVLVLDARILLRQGVPVHGDLTYPWRIENYMNNYLYLFTNAGSVSNLESVDRIFLLVPALLARLLGGESGLVHKFVFLSLPLVSLFSMSALLRFVLKRVNPAYIRPAVLIPSSLLYAFSPWVLEQLQAYLFWLAYALTPLLILLTFQLFDRPRVGRAVALALVLFFIASTPQYLAYSLFVVTVIGVIELTHQVKTRGSPQQVLGKLARPVLAFLLSSVILNFYWIYPVARIALAGDSVGPGYKVDRATTSMFSTESNLLNVARGYDQWVYWYQHDPSLGIVFTSPYMLVTLFPPVLGVVALLSKEGRRSRHFLILAGLAASFGLISLGTNTPILNWLVFDAPLIRRRWVDLSSAREAELHAVAVLLRGLCLDPRQDACARADRRARFRGRRYVSWTEHSAPAKDSALLLSLLRAGTSTAASTRS